MTKQQAIDFFGSSVALAQALSVKPQSISQWDDIPARRQYELERISNGKLKVDSRLISAA